MISENPKRPLPRATRVVGSVILAAIPCYGFVAHASRDPQHVFFLIFGAWFVTCASALVVTVRALTSRAGATRERWAIRSWGVCLWVAGIVGWYGVRQAFYELMAG